MQTTLDKKKGYDDGIECCADDYAEPDTYSVEEQNRYFGRAVDLKDELEEQLGHEVNYPVIVEDDDCPCPDDCPVIRDHADPDEHCPHCSLESLTMGYTPPYLRKRYV